jgi:hypothetical protein
MEEAPERRLERPRNGERELVPREHEHGREDDLDLPHREGDPEAAPRAAAERQPGVGIGLLADEPVEQAIVGLQRGKFGPVPG